MATALSKGLLDKETTEIALWVINIKDCICKLSLSWRRFRFGDIIIKYEKILEQFSNS